jgi:hypothetical protein
VHDAPADKFLLYLHEDFFRNDGRMIVLNIVLRHDASVAPSCISAAIRRRLPLTSAISGLIFLRQPTVRVSAEMLPLYRPSTREMAFQKQDL